MLMVRGRAEVLDRAAVLRPADFRKIVRDKREAASFALEDSILEDYWMWQYVAVERAVVWKKAELDQCAWC